MTETIKVLEHYPELIHIDRSEPGEVKFYFKDRTISTFPLKHSYTGNLSTNLYHLCLRCHHRYVELILTQNTSQPGKRGELEVHKSKVISKESCVALFEQGIMIFYRNSADTEKIYYDRVAIERKVTIEKLLNEN